MMLRRSVIVKQLDEPLHLCTNDRVRFCDVVYDAFERLVVQAAFSFLAWDFGGRPLRPYLVQIVVFPIHVRRHLNWAYSSSRWPRKRARRQLHSRSNRFLQVPERVTSGLGHPRAVAGKWDKVGRRDRGR